MRESARQVLERLRVAWPGRSIFLGINADSRYTVGFITKVEGHAHAQVVVGRSWTDAADKALLHPENDARPTHGLCECGNDFPLRPSGRGNQPKWCAACVGAKLRERNRNRAALTQGKD